MITTGKSSIRIVDAIGKRDKLGIYSTFPKPLLQEISYIKNISYIDKVFIPEVDDDIEGMFDSLKKLWREKYGLTECFEIFERYQKFEPILFEGLHYRDHFIHQYLVFLTGLPIINQYGPNIKTNLSRIDGVTEDLIDIEKSWLLASTYHDVSYPVQSFEVWLKTFFLDFLNISSTPIHINMSPVLLERDYLFHLNTLSNFLFKLYKGIRPVLKKEDIDRLCMEKFLERNHGIFSSLILLDKYPISLGPSSEKYSSDLFFSQVLPSAVAIALHDSDVWDEEIIPKIIFEKDSLSFLLIYCDTVQEWGRPLTPYSGQQSPYAPLMTAYKINDQKVSITLTYDAVEEVKLPDGTISTNFDLKMEEVLSLFSTLKSSTIEFEIILESIDPDFDRNPYVKGSKDD